MSTENAAVAVPETIESNAAELSPEDAAVAYINEQAKSETVNAKPEEKVEPKAESAELKPDDPKPEPDKVLAELSTKQQKVDAQIQAAKRIEERNKAEEAKLASSRVEFEKERAEVVSILNGDLPTIVERAAKLRGIDVSVVWNEFVEMAKNGGKLPEHLATRREVEALKADKQREQREREAAETAKRDEEAKANDSQAWAEVIDESLGDSRATQVWPKLMAMPENERIELMLVNARAQYEHTGKLPNQIRFLSWIESQLPEAAPPVAAAATQPKTAKPGVVVPSGKDASAPPTKRDDMTEEELIDEAARWLQSQG